MSDQIYWVLEVRINDGKGDAVKSLMQDMIESVEAESGTLAYEWTLGEDRKTCHIFERYEDSAAVMAHLAGFGAFAERFMGAVTPTRLTVHGSPNGSVREALAGFGPTYLASVGGFTR